MSDTENEGLLGLILNEKNEVIRLSDDKVIAVIRPEQGGGEESIQYAHWKFKEYAPAILQLVEEGPTSTVEPAPEQEPAPEKDARPTIKGGEFDGFPEQTSAGDLTPGWPEKVLEVFGRDRFNKQYAQGMRLIRYNKDRAKNGLPPIQ